jgi:hypothetical protein
MITKRLLSEDRLAGTREYVYYDDVEDTVSVQTEQDDHRILDLNQRLRNEHDERAPWKDDSMVGVRVASIPLVLYHDLVRQGRLRTDADRRAFLNASENKVFRTRPGRV